MAASGCVTDDDFKAQNRRISALQNEIQDLNKQVKARDMALERQLTQTRDNFPDIRLEMDRMRTELQRLTNIIEVNERRGALPGGETLTLKDQLDHIRARLDRAETKLRLPPLPIAAIEDPKAAGDTSVTTGEPNITVAPDAVDADEVEYGAARDLFKAKDYDGAVEKFKNFLNEFPKSQYSAAAQFYVGECLYFQKNYEEAILEYQQVIEKYPKSSRVSIAMLKQAYSFLNIGDKTSAKVLLKKVISDHPKSYAAGVAREKLPSLD